MPKVSIILPTYNGSKYIRTSIDSCLRQTFKDFELIVVDDASTDDTPQIIKSYDDPRIKYIRNPRNQRLPSSLNIGFTYSKGAYLTWTSDDNMYLPQALERMVKVMESYRYDFVYADNFIFQGNDLTKTKRLVLDDPTQLRQSNCIRACFLYSRRVMQKVGCYDPDMELIEDYDYWVRVSKYFYMHHIPEALYYYRYHNDQLYCARNKEIKIVEFLFKFKYGFMSQDLVEWNLRSLKGINNFYQKMSSFLIKKPMIKKILDQYKKGTLSFLNARKSLNQIIYGFKQTPKKTFFFLRRLPMPPEGEWGGLERLMFDWFERIDYARTNVFVGVTPGWKQRFQEEAQKLTLPLNVVELKFNFNDGILKRFWRMWLFLRSFHPDAVVYFQGHFMEFSVAEVFAGSLSCHGNVFMHENISSPMPPEKVSKRYFGFLPGLGIWWQVNRLLVNARGYMAKRVLVVSQEIKSRYVSWWKYPQKQVSVMYHGTDTQKFSPSTAEKERLRNQLNIRPEDIIIISTARLSKIKRVDRILKAFDLLSKDFTNLRLMIAGQGPLENDLRQLAASLHCRDRITFLGHLKDTSDYLKASDIFVLSSDNEGLSLALLEAMAAGLICISTNCAGSNEAIINENLGLIVDKSVEGVAQGLKRILSLPKEKQQEMSGTAMDFIRKNFDLNTNIQKVFKTIGLVN